MENDEKKIFYETKWEDQWSLSREHYGPMFFHRKRMIQNLIKNNFFNRRVLDVGCGDGTLLNLFKKNAALLYGCDISEKAIQLAKMKYGNIANFSMGDVTRPDTLPEGKFDVIICSEVLEHIENDELAIKNVYTKLVKNGYLIVTVPHMKEYWLSRDDSDGHIRRYEIEELEKKITRNGFTVCELKTWGYPLLHWYYKFFLKNVEEQTVNKIVKKSKVKQTLSFILRSIFYMDDFFIPLSKGRNIYLLAKKEQSK